ncbi:hypothetical protein GCM10027418_20720 [Mariniluteicoccus endophyticus]
MPTRRSVLVTAGGVGVAALGGTLAMRGCDGAPVSPSPDAPCVPRSQMVDHATVGDAQLVYEEDKIARRFSFDEGFHRQLEGWLADWRTDAGALGAVTAIDTYGAWTDGGTQCASWHNAGRAFDIARLRAGKATLVSCREDLWSALPAAQRDAHRRGYWRLAAHLHARFAYVLTYLFDDLHRNHIHLDNGVSGSGRPRFTTRSRVQNQVVQACSTYVWGVDCPITGTWDAATKKASRAVLEQIGASGQLTSGDNWQRFMEATAARG